MITSTSNPRIKVIRLLQKAKERRIQGSFIIEGLKEIEKAIYNDYQINAIFYCPDIISKDQVAGLIGKSAPIPTEEVSVKVYNHLAYRENNGGIIATAKPRKATLKDLRLSEKPLLLVLEAVEKPGNIGAILRTADAAGIDGIIVCDQQTDIYNPNVIRSSLGCVFTVPTVVTRSLDAIVWLKERRLFISCAALTASKPYHSIDFTQATAIVMGAEDTGLSDLWLEASDQNIIIPMYGEADSMNVSVSAAILVFEAIRQRVT